jgi:hypothetical protein
MTDQEERQPDKEPAPLKHTDAERVSGEEQEAAEELAEDPSRNPDDKELRDIKGG